MKHRWLRNGATTVEVVPMMIKRQDTLRRLHCSKVSARLEFTEQKLGQQPPHGSIGNHSKVESDDGAC